MCSGGSFFFLHSHVMVGCCSKLYLYEKCWKLFTCVLVLLYVLIIIVLKFCFYEPSGGAALWWDE